MAESMNLNSRKVFLLSIILLFFTSSSLISIHADSKSQSGELFRRRGRRVLESDQDLQLPKKKKKSNDSVSISLSTKSQNNTLFIKTKTKTNQTNFITNLSSKNKTKLAKSTNSTRPISEINLKKLNSTSFKVPKLKTTNSTKKSSDLLKLTTPKNKTEPHLEKTTKNDQKKTDTTTKKQTKPSWVDEDSDEDFVSEFRELPTKFQQTLIPDLAKLSTTSKAYIFQANKQMTKGFKPIVGNKYASTIASIISFAFILIPLILVTLIFNRIKAYFSLQKLLIFIQVYLSIYFSILCLSSLITALEPLKFLYATSQSTYVCLQVMQTLAYILYLLLLVMYLVLVFSTDCGLGSRMLGLAQTFVGYAVGLHYYVAVFHRMVLHQPPKTNWKVHGIYATCFMVICFFAGAERRKKSYLEEGGAEGKKS